MRVLSIPTAGVDISKGVLVVNTKYVTMYNRLYNVTVDITDGEMTVRGEQPKYEIFIMGIEPPEDVSVFCEEDLYWSRIFPFFGKKVLKVRRNQWVEYKKREPKTYISNNYTIIK